MSIRENFKSLSLSRFLEEIEVKDLLWIVKRLSGNDTGLTGGHQAGLYLPRIFFEKAVPEICSTHIYNPDAYIAECYFPQCDSLNENLRAIYYNSKFFPEKKLQKKYNEFRITKWGGSNSPVQDVENTGSLCVLAFGKKEDKSFFVVWVASSIEEEDLIEEWLGCSVEPGRFELRGIHDQAKRKIDLPEDWNGRFPSGKEIFDFTIKKLPKNYRSLTIDKLLLERRELEFSIFEIIEQAAILPRIHQGFSNVEEFIKYAHTVSNRRKSRAGTSLELNLEIIFRDEEITFEMQAVTENHKKPDFLFPSSTAYHNSNFPVSKLNMLAAKTCCKDRWRQVINEADRIITKHLFTLQEGVSENQFKEMKDNHVALVIPEPHLTKFPENCRADLITLGGFVKFIKQQQI